MGLTIARLLVAIGADSSEAKKELSGINADLNSYGNKMMKNGALLTAAISTPAFFAAKSMLNVAASMEQSAVAFSTMLRSGEKAEVFLKDLQDFAATTPFEFMELQDASRRMLAFGFAAEDILPMMTNIGDAVSGLGLGSEGVNRVTLALGQMQAKTKVSAQEMMQLTEAGIPAWRYLSESMGLTTAETMKLSEKGLIPAGDAIQAILKGMEQDFGGMMAEQSKTAAGQVSNLKDELNYLATDLGTMVLPAAKDFLTVARDTVQTISEMPDWTKKAALGLGGIALAAGPTMTVLGGVVKLGAGLPALVGNIGNIGLGLAAGMNTTSAIAAAGLSAVGVSVAAIAAILASLVAVGVAFKKNIIDMNKAGQEMVSSTWTKFFEDQIASGKSATEITQAYTEAQARMREEMSVKWTMEGGTPTASFDEMAKLIVNQKKALDGSSELANVLLKTSGSYEEYTAAMNAANLAGLQVAKTAWDLAHGFDAAAVAASDTEMFDRWIQGGQTLTDTMSGPVGLESVLGNVNTLMGEFTTELLFNQAAAGLDAEASILLAEKMGLIDPATKAAMEALELLRQGLQSGAIAADDYYGKVDTLNDVIKEMQDKHITITIDTIERYTKQYWEDLSSLNTSNPGGNRPGGIQQANGGDWLVKEPTWFLAGEAGWERATFEPVGGSAKRAGGDGVTIHMHIKEVSSEIDMLKMAQSVANEIRRYRL